MPANTKACPHRPLRFTTSDDLHAEVARLAAAEQSGRLTQHGNWTLGQTLNHLGTWANFAHDGFPGKPPFFVRWFMKFRKNRYIHGTMPRGVHIPGIEGGTLGIEPAPTAAALAMFESAWTHLKGTAPVLPNPLFGPMTHDEWINMHLRHAELHLGFLDVGA